MRETMNIKKVKTVFQVGRVGRPPRSPYFDITTYVTLCARRDSNKKNEFNTHNNGRKVKGGKNYFGLAMSSYYDVIEQPQK